jgi:hypothetical protein
MKPVECEFEADVLAAVLQSRWPDHVDAELRAHAAACPICSEVASVAGAFGASLEEMRSSAEIPDANRIWWQSQLRARREAVAAAGRPITAVQVIAFACAVGLLGACFGATSTWFQATLKRIAANVAGFDVAAFLTATATLFTEHGLLAVGLIAIVFLVPTAVYVVLARD